MKRIIRLALIFSMLLVLAGCSKIDYKAAKAFKEDYESLNGQTNARGTEYRTVKIDSKNPFVTTTAEEIVKKVENKETFYVYFGDKMCPWCRSVIEKAVEVANDNKITTIYYVPIWNDNHEEVVRDKYIVNEDGELEKTVEGTDAYKTLIEKFASVLEEYTVSAGEGVTINIGEKRIYAPNFIYVSKGEAIRMTPANSPKQEGGNDPLTKEILDDEVKMLNEFFKGTTCTDSSHC